MNGTMCALCKEKTAKIHITQIHGDEIRELHVCQECAKNNGITTHGTKTKLSIETVMGGVLEGEEGARIENPESNKTCPVCGQTFRGFRESGRLGCRHCYEAFGEELVPLLKKVQMGMTRHGKPSPILKPTRSIVADIQKMREDLQLAIGAEDFQEAARLRDEIRNLEKQAKE